MYWFKEQTTLYKIINRYKNSYFTMDVTGSIAKKLPLPDGTKSAHFFFVPVRNRSGKQTWYPSFPDNFRKTRCIPFNFFFIGNLESGCYSAVCNSNRFQSSNTSCISARICRLCTSQTLFTTIL